MNLGDDEPSLYQPEFNEDVVHDIMNTQKKIQTILKIMVNQINYLVF